MAAPPDAPGASFRDLLEGLAGEYGRVCREKSAVALENSSLRRLLREAQDGSATKVTANGVEEEEAQVPSTSATSLYKFLMSSQATTDRSQTPESTFTQDKINSALDQSEHNLTGDWDLMPAAGPRDHAVAATTRPFERNRPYLCERATVPPELTLEGTSTPGTARSGTPGMRRSRTSALEELKKPAVFNPLSADAEVPSTRREWLFENAVESPEKAQSFRRSTTNGQGMSFIDLRVDQLLAGQAVVETGMLQRFVIRPNSLVRMLWDILSVFMIAYDVISIPLTVFELPETTFTTACEWVTTIFWTLDIMMSFMTGFHRDGIVEMRPRQIAHRYMRTWFGLDLLIVLFDWLLMAFAHSMDAILRLGKSQRATRILKVFRTIRLMRALKLGGTLKELYRHVKSELLRILIVIGVLLTGLIMMNHYLACGWYGIGGMNVGVQPNWLEFHNLPGQDLKFVYATSLHWTLTQFTPAAMEVYPHNLPERVYAIFVLLFALVTFSSFVSSMTSSMMEIKKLKSEPKKQEAILRQYFKEHRISAELGQKIWDFLRSNHFNHWKAIKQEDVKVLKLLPNALRSQLSEELYMPTVLEHPFFRTFDEIAGPILLDVIHRCVGEVSLTTGDAAFREGEDAKKLWFLTSGTMDYRHRDSVLCCQLMPGGWACEHVIWLEWVHCGLLSAHTSCELVHIEAKTFCMVVNSRLGEFERAFVRLYAEQFHEMLVEEELWFTDLTPDIKVIKDLAQKADEVASTEMQDVLAMAGGDVVYQSEEERPRPTRQTSAGARQSSPTGAQSAVGFLAKHMPRASLGRLQRH